MTKMSDEYVTALQNVSAVTEECAKKLTEVSVLCQRTLVRGEFSKSGHEAIISLLSRVNKLGPFLQDTIQLGAITGLAALDAEEKRVMLELQEKRNSFISIISNTDKPKPEVNVSLYTRGIFAHPIHNALGKKIQVLKTTRLGVIGYLKDHNKPPYGEQSTAEDILEALKAINAPELSTFIEEVDVASAAE